MSTKFGKIAEFISSLENEEINENEQAFLLVGGSGSGGSGGNVGCSNTSDCRGTTNAGCSNTGTC